MIIKKSRETSIKLWVEALIFLCSYYPLFLILFIRDLGAHESTIQIGLSEWGIKVTGWAISGLLISSIATLLTGYIIRNLFEKSEGESDVTLTEVKVVRGDMINYTLPFLIGLFAFDYQSWQSILSLIVFLWFMFVFTRNEKIILLNPMFLLLGIRLYDIKYKKVGQSQKEHSTSALCLGTAKASSEKVRLLENSGINFISEIVGR